ncbi:IMPACT family protein [Alkalilimnicola ehrlichii MLHE-1]|uniref:YigZ family protein n=1 Tax=Alkalilimnicola ehrlichii (strain ATCC BAA-1101 / DSM 17681 / MLHE-1) TaxID=187272 RepID=Q0A6M1_ALKEH|nr:YigZ family protein [Alkalilimnicola ehrlichii]ABI57516.1 protein of unknown function UPF0029 [Alkalilimnicola ehrlichii MLHE-1]
MPENTYPTPARTLEHELEVKKSRFIARAGRVESREQALAFVDRAMTDFPDARHHCWAYLIGDPASATTAAMSDAGEPSGTAGKPILNVIQHKRIGDVIVVVIRYFGGIKLGAGGLVRAYAGATQKVLAELPLAAHEPHTRCRLALDFAQEQPLRHWAAQHQATVEAVAYGEGVTLTLRLPEGAVAALRQFAQARGIRLETD